MTKAQEYGRLILLRKGIVNVNRIRLFDLDRHSCHSRLISCGKLYTPTDQTFELGANYEVALDFYDEVWFDGVCLYKKHWLKKIWEKVCLKK